MVESLQYLTFWKFLLSKDNSPEVFERVPVLFFRTLIQSILPLQERDSIKNCLKSIQYIRFIRSHTDLLSLHTYYLNCRHAKIPSWVEILSFIPPILSYTSLHKNIPDVKNLLELEYSHCRCNIKDVEYLVKKHKNLERLTMRRASHDNVPRFLTVLSSNFEKLNTLELTMCNIGDEGCRIISKSVFLENLTKLNLWNNSITHKGVGYLFEGRRDLSRLKHLTLGMNPIGDKGVECLTETLSVTYLNLHGCDLTVHSCEMTKHIEKVDLSGNPKITSKN